MSFANNESLSQSHSQALDNATQRLREKNVLLPQLSELWAPEKIPTTVSAELANIDPDEPHPLNLWRLHWYNDEKRRGISQVPGHLLLTSEVTGVEAPIVVLLGSRFPLIAAHKVLAAYGCLVPRLVSGGFDPTRQRALWPSTGNYCRGGVAISRILGIRGVAILPAGMSAERFDWLKRWTQQEGDIVRTPGTESNVKEIYDKCNELKQSPENVILNQFSEYGNYLVHYNLTGRAAADAVKSHALGIAAFVSATGSAGTIGAGDFLKHRYGTRIVAVEAAECPTLLSNGFGEHNIQGIGDKHVPLIHNAMNTDLVTAVSDQDTDALHFLFNHPEGQRYLRERRKWSEKNLTAFSGLGLSGICNVLAAIKTARYLRLRSSEAIVTVATDSSAMYVSEMEKHKARAGTFDMVSAAESFGEHWLCPRTDLLMELSLRDRERIFNLGYYTWVEQQGVPLADFEARRKQSFWQSLQNSVEVWDTGIRHMNQRTGLSPDCGHEGAAGRMA